MTHPQTRHGNGQHRRRIPRHLPLLATCLAVLTSGPATAEHEFRLLDECMETSTAFVRLPSSTGGTLDARNCEGCEALRLTFESETRFLVGRDISSYSRLLAAARKDITPLLVCYEPASRKLTRLAVPAGEVQ